LAHFGREGNASLGLGHPLSLELMADENQESADDASAGTEKPDKL
jgi:hypothetical protein